MNDDSTMKRTVTKPEPPKTDWTAFDAMTDEERDAYDNLILLCGTHHGAYVDGALGKYSAPELRQWKADHERWVVPRPPWMMMIANSSIANNASMIMTRPRGLFGGGGRFSGIGPS